MIKARNVFTSYNKSGPVETTGANSVMFINQGDGNITLNGTVIIGPDASFSIAQVSSDVVDDTEYTIVFAEGATINSCIVVKVGVYKTGC